MPVVHPADVWKASGRYDADRAGAGPVQGPRRPRHGPRDDPRGGRRALLARHRPVATASCRCMVYHFQTKFRDEPRVARRADPRPRVRHEGRLQLRPRRGRPRRQLRGAVRGLRPDLRAARARRDRRRRPTSGSWAAAGPTSSWSSTRPARTSSSCATRAATPPTSRSPIVRKPDPAPRTPLPMEEVETPGTTTIDALAAFLGIGPEPDGQGRVLRDRRRPARDRHRPRRLRGQRDEARQRGQGDRRAPAGHGRGDQGARAWSPATARRSAPTTRSSSSTSSSPRSPNLVAGREPRRASTIATSTSARDFTPDVVADITNAREGDACPTCGSAGDPAQRASRSATSSSSGPTFTDALGATYLGEDGERAPDRHGLVRDRRRAATSPASSRPTTTRRASSGRPRSRRTPPTSSRSARPRSRGSPRSPSALHAARRAGAGREILYDDRDESPGVKFTDAELLGHALDPDRQPALARGGRRRGHRTGDRASGRPARSRRSRRSSRAGAATPV